MAHPDENARSRHAAKRIDLRDRFPASHFGHLPTSITPGILPCCALKRCSKHLDLAILDQIAYSPFLIVVYPIPSIRSFRQCGSEALRILSPIPKPGNAKAVELAGRPRYGTDEMRTVRIGVLAFQSGELERNNEREIKDVRVGRIEAPVRGIKTDFEKPGRLDNRRERLARKPRDHVPCSYFADTAPRTGPTNFSISPTIVHTPCRDLGFSDGWTRRIISPSQS